MAFDHEKHAELLELLLSADREESEALDALNSFVSNRGTDAVQLSALQAQAKVAAERRRDVTRAISDLLATY